MRRHLHAVRQKFLHLDADRAEQQRRRFGRAGRGAAGVARQVQVEGHVAGRRTFLGCMREFRHAAGTEPELFAPHNQAARIGHLHLHRQISQLLRPALRLGDDADVDAIAGPVDTAIGKQIRLDLVRQAARMQAADIEARQVEGAVAVERQETQVAGFFHDQHHRQFFAHKTGHARQVRLAARIRILAHQYRTVATPHFDICAPDRLAIGDRLHEHVTRTVHCRFRNDAEIGHDHQAPFQHLGRVDLVFIVPSLTLPTIPVALAVVTLLVGLLVEVRSIGVLRVVSLHRQQEHPAPVGDVSLQVFGKIDRFVMRLAGPQVERQFLLKPFGQAVRRDASIELRLRHVTLALRDQVLQLLRQQASQFNAHARQVAHHQRQFLVARQRQQRPLAHDRQFRR